MNMTLGYALHRDRRVRIRTKLIALGIGAAGVGAIEPLRLPVEGVVAAALLSVTLLPFGVISSLKMVYDFWRKISLRLTAGTTSL